MGMGSLSPRVKVGLVGAAVLVALITTASMNSKPEPSADRAPTPATDNTGPIDTPAEPTPEAVTPVEPPQKAAPESHSGKPSGKAVHIAWETSYDTAVKKAKKANKLIMIDFYTEWCSWCKVLDTTAYVDPEVVTESKNFINLKINGDEAPNLAMKYRITGYPTIAWIDSGGNVVDRIDGYPQGSNFADLMRSARSKYTGRASA